LWFVTENVHKYKEARLTLDAYKISVRMLNSPKTELQSDSLEKVARFAAEEAAMKHKRTVVVEDSGLFVEALGGFPGPFSSYVYATIGFEGLLRLMSRESHRDAHFQSSLAVASARGWIQSFSAKIHGTIPRKALGKSGFGFDPVFIPKGTETTFAQGGAEFKLKHSHRAKAFRKLANWYTGRV
jgi:XTP/dITP diphosphohydrolase